MNDYRSDRRGMLGAGMLLAGAGALTASGANATAIGAAGGEWQPAMEPQDAWLNRPGTRHRMVFDATRPEEAQDAVFGADKLYFANKKGYALEPAALGMVIVLRHLATPFGFNDAMWRKYGAHFVKNMPLEGSDALRAVQGNPLLSAEDPTDKDAATLATLAAKGARFGVCGISTHGNATDLAKEHGGSAEAIEKELGANLVPGAVMTVAGVVAVNRALEHGYSWAPVR